MDLVERNKKLCDMYASGKTIPQISEESGVSPTQLSRIFRANDIKRKKYELDAEFFKEHQGKTKREISEITGLPLRRIEHLYNVTQNKKLSRGKIDFTDENPAVDIVLLNDPEWLYQKYVDEKLGAPTIAKLLAIHCRDVYKALLKFGIPKRSTKQMHLHKMKKPDKEWLIDAYVVRGWSIQKCAQEFESNWSMIYQSLRDYEIPIRSASTQHAGELNSFYGKTHSESTKLKCSQIGTKAGKEYWVTGDIEAKIELARTISKETWADPIKRSEASQRIAKLCQAGKCNSKSEILFIDGEAFLFKSSWEIAVAKLLMDNNQVEEWKYEQLILPYLDGEVLKNFVVDFYVKWKDGLETLIECKNQHLLSKPSEQLKIQALEDYSKLHNIPYILVDNKEDARKISLGYNSPVDWITPTRYKTKRDYLESPRLFHEIMFHEIIDKIGDWRDPEYTNEELTKDLNRLQKENLAGYWSGNNIRSTAPNGGGMPGRLIMQHFQPHFWRVRPINQKELPEAFSDKRILYRCLGISRDEKESLSFERLLREINFHYAGYGRTSHFAPGFARTIIKKFDLSGRRIFDPCMGWGGRLIGAWLEGCTYVGCDLSPHTCAGLEKIKSFLGFNGSQIINKSCLGAEWDGDAILTSPPFYNKEQYIGGEQPWLHNSSREEWCDNFVKPFVNKINKQAILYIDKETREDFEIYRKFDEIVIISNKRHARRKDGQEYLCIYY